jgi:hypothetical protein
MTAAAGSAVLLAGAATPAGAASVSAHPDALRPSYCSGVLRVNSFAFTPWAVGIGQSSSAALSVTNCTWGTQTVIETWTGHFSSNIDPGIPPGCPALDPLPRSVTLAPHEQVTTSTTYNVFPWCTASHLTVTVTISQGSTELARTSADLTIIGGG